MYFFLKKFGILFLLFSWNLLNAQQPTNRIVPPSPSSKLFEKYLDYPVNISTGVPEIKIPLYEIQVDGMTIPIELSYHASGIKYKQYDGDIGVGWVLNPGYRVTRTMYGRPDEDYALPPALDFENQINARALGYARDRYLSSFNSELTSPSYIPTPEGENLYDGEYDQFSYMLPSGTGHFIIDNRSTFSTSLLEKGNNFKVNITPVASFGAGVNEMKMIDDKGFSYYLGKSLTGTYQAEKSGSLNTSWPLMNIVSPNNEQVSFSYSIERQYNHTQAHKQNFDVSDAIQYSLEEYDPESFNLRVLQPTSYQDLFFVNEINTDQVRVLFTRVPSTASNPADHQRLDKIEIFSKSSGAILRTINMYYGQQDIHRVLDSVAVTNAGIRESYKLEYYPGGDSNSYYADQWGYHHAGAGPPTTRTYFHKEFYDVEFQATNWYSKTKIGPQFQGYLVDRGRTVSDDTPLNFTLKKITFPTRGTRTYEYEKNAYGTGTYGSGLRVKKILLDNSLGLINTRVYKYGLNENGFGAALFLPNYPAFMKQHLNAVIKVSSQNTYYSFGKSTMFSTELQGDASIDKDFSVVYTTVSEYDYNNDLSLHNGKTIYTFEPQFSNQLLEMYGEDTAVAFPLYVSEYAPFRQHRLLSKDSYTFKNNVFQLAQKEEYAYSVFSTGSFKGLKVAQVVNSNFVDLNSMNHSVPQWPYWGPSGIRSFFAYLPYQLFTGVDLMTTKHVTSYDGGGIFKTSTEYSYNQKNQLSKSTVYKSDGSKEISTTIYPADYGSGTVFIDNMNANNLISYPIEQVKYREVGTTRTMLSGGITKYKTGGKGLTDQIMNLDVKTPIALAGFKFSNKAIGILPPAGTSTAFSADTRYEVSVNYNSYDAKGNPLNVSRQMGPKTSYKWGYKDQYPIAEVKNSAANEFYSQNFEEPELGLDFEGNVPTDITQRHTGKYAGNLSNYGTTEAVSHSSKGINISLAAPKKFTYSGWIYSNGPSAEICLFMMKAGETGYFSYIDAVQTTEINKWVYVKKEFLVPADVVHMKLRIDNNAQGTVWFDDLRIQPSDADMSTYTYEPLVGMTSTVDDSGKTVYFEYDSFQRLKNIRNHKGEIIKSYEYHYKP